MNIGLIIALVAVLLVLVIGYNVMLQYKVKAETAKRQESARYVAVIDATEELIGHAHHIPYSKDLLVCLNNRILDALENMAALDPKTIRNEHNKGRFDTQAYVEENARLETMQIRINIENVIKRAHDSIARGQAGTAVQLLRKGIDVLSTKNDAYSVQAKEKLETMLNEVDKKRSDKNAVELQQMEEKERNNDMDALFGDKKKW